MEVINFMKNYWTQIIFFATMIIAFAKYSNAMVEATKCSLRNDILEIWDKCKDKKEITEYQLQAIKYSYDQYKKLHGNSFVEDIVERVKSFEIID